MHNFKLPNTTQTGINHRKMLRFWVVSLLSLLCSQPRGIIAKKFQPSKRGSHGVAPGGHELITTGWKMSEADIMLVKRALVHGIPFKDLPDGIFDDLVSSCDYVKYSKDSVIFEEGDTDTDFLVVIREGNCKILIEGQPLPEPYGTAGTGSIIGELALLYGKSRAATVVAATHVSAFRLDREKFKGFMQYIPEEDEEQLKKELSEVDRVLDKVSGVKKRYDGDIIRQFMPGRGWLWSRWKGTILHHAWKTAIVNIVVSLAFSALIRNYCHPTWDIGELPDQQNPIISRLVGLKIVWKYLMSVTTFILTFFLSHAFSLWRDFYSLARRIQGRLNDLGMLIATAAKRDKNGRYTEEAKSPLDDTSSYFRLFHVFMWASFAKKLNVLLSDTGLRRMISRGLLSMKQYETLRLLNTNAGYANVCMIWILTRCLYAMHDDSLANDPVLREQIYIKVLALRSTCASIPDMLDGRIPLAYVHMVQILVDIFVFLSPFALYSELGIWSTAAVALLGTMYSGLLDLSKILLDPLDNDDFYNESVNMDMGVLIRESNSGSTRWRHGAEFLPF